MELPIATGFYEDAVKLISAQECINWLPQTPQTSALSQAQLVNTQGISLLSTVSNFAGRGAIVMDSLAYTVNGTQLHRVDDDGTVTNLGTISGSGRVSMATNGTQICIVVPGGTSYVYSVSGGLVTIVDSDFTTTLGPSQQVVFVDGYFVHYNNASAASNQAVFFVSNLNDATAYDPLDFGTAEADPDNITGLHVNANRLHVGGFKTIEPMSNIGGSGFPFQRINGGLIQKGVRAKFTLQDFDNSFCFVGGGKNEQPAVWRLSGQAAQKISTAAIDNILQDLTVLELSEVFSTTYAENGAYIYYIHLNNRTFGYDASTQLWHERKSKDASLQLVNWRVNEIIQVYGKVLVTDAQSGRIGILDKDIYTEYGESVQRIVTTQPFSNQGNDLSFSDMELTCLTGTAQGVQLGLTGYLPGDYISDDYFYEDYLDEQLPPTVQRQFSDDGGYTWSNITSRSLGRIGQREIRQIWRREGNSKRFRIYRFIIDEPVKTAIIKLEIELAA